MHRFNSTRLPKTEEMLKITKLMSCMNFWIMIQAMIKWLNVLDDQSTREFKGTRTTRLATIRYLTIRQVQRQRQRERSGSSLAISRWRSGQIWDYEFYELKRGRPPFMLSCLSQQKVFKNHAKVAWHYSSGSCFQLKSVAWEFSLFADDPFSKWSGL